MRFDPGRPQQPEFVAYSPAAIPDRRDDVVEQYVEAVRHGGPPAVAAELTHLSDAARGVLRAFAERSASRAVHEDSVERLVSALVAIVLGGLDQNAQEAMMPMALVEDAGRRIGAEAGEYFGIAAAVVGHPASVNLLVWLGRRDEDRTPEVMGFIATHDKTGFRYKWAG